MKRTFGGVINVDIRDSVPDRMPYEEPKAPEGAANVLMIVLDDVGFSAMSCYGGLIETPNIDRLGANGLLYTQWHTTALRSPTRACLLTGRRLGIASPNNDTLYSMSQVDPGNEPLVFHAPATGNRSYVMQFVDARSNNLAYVGTRATGSGRSIPPHSPHVHAGAGGIRREPVVPAADPASGVTKW